MQFRTETTDFYPERTCVTCGENGHWYLHCNKVGFFDLVAGSLGVALPSGKTYDQLKEDIQDVQT